MIKPVGNWILVEQMVRGETGGGIALPENLEVELPYAIVKAIGETCWSECEEIPVKVGNKVMMQASRCLKTDDGLLVSFAAVVAVIEEFPAGWSKVARN